MRRLLEISDKTLGLLTLMALATVLLLYLDRTARVPVPDGLWPGERVAPAVRAEP
ncbi:MAG: hypothetical protein GY711_19425 [bacterium]|nr:hypothetical protein [bacterium]